MADQKAHIRITADAAQATRSMGQFKQSLQDIKQPMADFAAGLSAVGALQVVRNLTEAGLAMERLQMQFKAASGNAALAAREFAYVTQLSNKMGLEFRSTAEAYGKFMAATRGSSIEGNQARKVFESVSTAVTALGLSADTAGRAFLQLQQMVSKGKISAEDLNILAEAIPGIKQIMESASGKTGPEFAKMMQDGKALTSDILPKMAEQLQKVYGAAAVEAANKGTAAFNRLKNEIFETSAAIGTNLIPALAAGANAMANFFKAAREGDGWQKYLAYGLSPGLTMATRMNKGGEAGDAAHRQVVDDQFRNYLQDRINASRKAAEKAALAAMEKKAKTPAAKRGPGTEYIDAGPQTSVKSIRERMDIDRFAMEEWTGLNAMQSSFLIAQAPKKQQFGLGTNTDFFGMEQNEKVKKELEKDAEERLAIEKRYTDEVTAMRFGAAESAIGILRQMAGENKAIAIGLLVAQKAMAVAQILMNTEVAASAALLAPPVGLGPVLGEPLAMKIRAMGYISAGLSAVSGIMEGLNMEGKATGGPVSGGTPYMVGERGPEVFVPAVSGTIIPNDRLGGAGVSVTNVFQVSTGVSDTVRAELMQLMPTIERRTLGAVQSAIESGGPLAKSVGRA